MYTRKANQPQPTHRFTLHPTVSLSAVAQRLPFTYTGADFYALCSDAMLKAVTRQAGAVDAKVRALNEQLRNNNNSNSAGAGHAVVGEISTANFFDHHATPDDVAVMVTEQDFVDAHRELVPSVSAGELAHYERVRATFEGGRGGGGEAAAGAGAGAGVHGEQQQGFSVSFNNDDGSTAEADTDKGKGKAVATAAEPEHEYGGYGDGGYGDGSVINGSGGGGSSDAGTIREKGKGKAVARFQDGSASDDDGLY